MKNQPASSAPVSIPLVVLTVHRNGTITVTRDGIVLPPPAPSVGEDSSRVSISVRILRRVSVLCR